MTVPRTCTIVVLVSLLAGCGQTKVPATAPVTTDQTARNLERFEYSQIHMGVRTRLVVYASDETAAVNACRAAFKRVAAVDRAASDYLKNSELNRLCATAATRPVALSEDLYTLLAEAQRLSELTGGAFDVTVGPYVQLWRAARKAGRLPDPAELAEAGKRVGWRKLELNPANRTARLAVSGMKLDLGGIAKGYAGDCAIATLKEQGIASALFEAGGDIVVSGAPPGTEGWVVAFEDAGGDMPEEVRVKDCAVSTSGDTVQFVEIGGTHYSHVVDPRTGVGVTTRLMGTVVAPKGIWADALSKSVYLIGEGERARLLKHYPGVRAYVREVASSGNASRAQE